MDKYIYLYGKKYLRCICCHHYNKAVSRCKLYDVACAIDDGCEEESIKQAEQEVVL